MLVNIRLVKNSAIIWLDISNVQITSPKILIKQLCNNQNFCELMISCMTWKKHLILMWFTNLTHSFLILNFFSNSWNYSGSLWKKIITILIKKFYPLPLYYVFDTTGNIISEFSIVIYIPVVLSQTKCHFYVWNRAQAKQIFVLRMSLCVSINNKHNQ